MAKGKKQAQKKGEKKEEKKSDTNNKFKGNYNTVIGVVVIILAGIVIFQLLQYTAQETPGIEHVEVNEEKLKIDTSIPIERSQESAMRDAMKFEYQTITLLDEALAEHGDIHSFQSIKDEKQEHIDILRQGFIDYELDVPDNYWEGRIVLPQNIADSCRRGVQAEDTLVNFYTAQLVLNKENENLVKIFTTFKEVSEKRHKLLFEACM